MKQTACVVPALIALLAAAPGLAADGGRVVAAFAAETSTLDPARSSGTVDRMYFHHMFEMLVAPDDKGGMAPWLATRWEVGEQNGKAFIEVWLRDDVRFHNGDPMTARDVEFTWQRLRDPQVSTTASRHRNVERFEIFDDHHFRIHFSQPDGNYLAEYLQLVIMPKKYFEEVGGAEAFGLAPVGTGPWKFGSRVIRQELNLLRNDDYWNVAAKPGAAELTIKIIPEDLTRVSALRNGEVDWIDNVPLPLVAEFKADARMATFSAQNGNFVYLDFPSHDPSSPFADARVRRAIAQGFDMDAILNVVLNGQGNRFAGLGSDSPALVPELQPYAFDPEASRRLLAEAGFPDGFETPCYSMITPREANIKDVGDAIYAYLGQVGIRCQIESVEYGAWVAMMRRGTQPELDGIAIHMSAQGIPPDPGNSWSSSALHSFAPEIGFGSFSQTADARADAMVQQIQQTMDMEKRQDLITEAALYRQDQVLGGISLYQPVTTYAWNKRIAFTPVAYPGYWHLLQHIAVAE